MSGTPLRSRFFTVFRVVAITFGVVLGLAAMSGWLPNFWWPFWLLQHLRLQLTVALIMNVALLLLVRAHRTALVLAGPVLLNCVVLIPMFVGGTQADSSLSLTHINVDRDKVEALAYANQYGSDIVFLQEVQPKLVAELDTMSNYWLVESSPEANTQGSAMLVRNDWEGRVVSSEVVQLHDYYRPFVAATIEVDNQALTLLSFHAIRPFAANTIATHRLEMENLAAWVSKQENPVVVVGDFNATPWSSAVAPLKEQGLVVSMNGHGFQPSWPSSAPKVLRIPIDICLHSPEWVTVARSVGDNVGSDHLPLHLELAPVRNR